MPSQRRRSSDNFFTRYVIPALIGLAATASAGAFTLAWNISTRVALLEQKQWVTREEFVRVETELEAAKDSIERLRTWMTNHVRSTRDIQNDYPAAAAPPPGSN